MAICARNRPQGNSLRPFLCTENPQLGWRGSGKLSALSQLLKYPFDLLKHLAVWQLQVSNKKWKKCSMGNEKSLAHTRWNCKYHIVFAPKYRRQVFYREKRRAIGSILRKLCEWKSVRILEAECCADHIHMLVEIPPKMSVSGFMGYLKGKSSLMLYEQFGDLKFKYGTGSSGAEGTTSIQWVRTRRRYRIT